MDKSPSLATDPHTQLKLQIRGLRELLYFVLGVVGAGFVFVTTVHIADIALALLLLAPQVNQYVDVFSLLIVPVLYLTWGLGLTAIAIPLCLGWSAVAWNVNLFWCFVTGRKTD
jgi:hypothetical protein